MLEFIVTQEEANIRLDKYLSQKTNISRSQIIKHLDAKLVKVNNYDASCFIKII